MDPGRIVLLAVLLCAFHISIRASTPGQQQSQTKHDSVTVQHPSDVASRISLDHGAGELIIPHATHTYGRRNLVDSTIERQTSLRPLPSPGPAPTVPEDPAPVLPLRSVLQLRQLPPPMVSSKAPSQRARPRPPPKRRSQSTTLPSPPPTQPLQSLSTPPQPSPSAPPPPPPEVPSGPPPPPPPPRNPPPSFPLPPCPDPPSPPLLPPLSPPQQPPSPHPPLPHPPSPAPSNPSSPPPFHPLPQHPPPSLTPPEPLAPLFPPPPRPPSLSPSPPSPSPRTLLPPTILAPSPTPPQSPPDTSVLPLLGGGNCSDPLAVLGAANAYRAWHDASPLQWSPDLAAAAQTYAEVLAARQCALEHAGVGGECLYGLTSFPKPDWSCKRAIDAWYSEVKAYDFAAANPFDVNNARGTGHFVQLVWRSSTSFGCGVARADVPMSKMPGGVGGCKVVVCRFRPGFRANNAAYMLNVFPRMK